MSSKDGSWRHDRSEVMADISLLKKLLLYNAETGTFSWLVNQGRARKGGVAGCPDNKGYINIMIKGVNIKAHRLAWAFLSGDWPENQIDHINQNKADNRIANLRAAENVTNHCNRGKNKNNKSGYKGVFWDNSRSKWVAHIMRFGKGHHLGRFSDIEDAKKAYDDAAKIIHGDFFYGGKEKPDV